MGWGTRVHDAVEVPGAEEHEAAIGAQLMHAEPVRQIGGVAGLKIDDLRVAEVVSEMAAITTDVYPLGRDGAEADVDNNGLLGPYVVTEQCAVRTV